MHGIQTWVALPETQEETDPAFDHYGSGVLPELDDGGLRARLVAGNAWGLVSPVRTHSPMFYLHCELDEGATVALPDEHSERAAYVVTGAVESAGRRHEAGSMLVFAPGPVTLTASGGPALLMLLGGEPVGERFIEWNFVSSSKERIEQAKADWRAGRMKLPDLDNGERIPLPGDPEETPPEAMS